MDTFYLGSVYMSDSLEDTEKLVSREQSFNGRELMLLLRSTQGEVISQIINEVGFGI